MPTDDARPRPTMREVAALAGVSLKTVSRVVNGEPGVSGDLTDRVQLAAQRLDYQPNLTASSLRRNDGKTKTIGLLLENVANPFSSALHRAVEDVARPREWWSSPAAWTRTTPASASWPRPSPPA